MVGVDLEVRGGVVGVDFLLGEGLSVDGLVGGGDEVLGLVGDRGCSFGQAEVVGLVVVLRVLAAEES